MAKYLVWFALVAYVSAVNIKQSVLEKAFAKGSEECDRLKKLYGLEYEQLDNSTEKPDLDQLSLKYVTANLNVSVNINSVARLLPKSLAFHEKQLIIYVHGFTDNPNKKSYAAISSGYISRGQHNVLALDGSSLIGSMYLRSTTYVRFIGIKLGSIIADLVRGGLPACHIHVIGHSLGAQISGFTGKQFTNLTGQKLSRITGLDPAGPCFAQLGGDLKLNATDAHYVDVIHTNAGVAGIKEPIGQVDYYPNDGEQQPGCPIDDCSHSRSWIYYGESLQHETAFPALQCASWDAFKKGECNKTISYMGVASKPGTTGTYYLQTASESPFGLGMNGTTYEKKGFFKKLFN